MKPIFGRGPSLQLRLILAVISSLLLLFVDSEQLYLQRLRNNLTSVLSPIFYMADLPSSALESGSVLLSSRQQLLQHNRWLTQQHLRDSEKLVQLSHLERENNRLRRLLESPLRQDAKKMVAEVIRVDADPNRLLVMLNRGEMDGVYIGQPVLDDRGIVGQVVEVALSMSRVLLIADATHAIPVRVARNDVRSIAVGSGRLAKLALQHLPHSTDIQVGDKLVSSGLGGRFPEGYPVGEVAAVHQDLGQPFTQVEIKPEAQLDRLRYLLLIWRKDQHVAAKEAEHG